MDELTLRLAGQVIQSPHFSPEEKNRIKRLVCECSEREEELILLRDCFGNMSMQYFKPGISEDNAGWLKREMGKISYKIGKLSSNIMSMYVCGMGPVFERLAKIQN